MFDKDGRPLTTELDLYNAIGGTRFEKADNPRPNPDHACITRRPEDGQRKTKQEPGWLSRPGWDAKKRQQIAETSCASCGSCEGGCHSVVNNYSSYFSSPFDNPRDTIPWLLVNPYSPIFLSNPNQPHVRQVRLSQGIDHPFRIVDTLYARPPLVQFNDRREELAKRLPWADAFEDLVSLQQTGKMVARDQSTYKIPHTWIHDMVYRGSLGRMWGFNEGGQMTRLGSPRENQIRPEAARRREEDLDMLPSQHSPEAIISAGVVAAAIQAVQEMKQLAIENEVDKPDSIAKTPSPQKEEPATHLQTPNEASWSSTTWSSSAPEPAREQSDSIISSSTTTERWTRPDGTIETRRVFKRRFSDGREVEEETHNLEEPQEIRSSHAVSLQQAPWPVGPKELESTNDDKVNQKRSGEKQTQTKTPIQDELKRRQGGGWFWK